MQNYKSYYINMQSYYNLTTLQNIPFLHATVGILNVTEFTTSIFILFTLQNLNFSSRQKFDL